MPIPFLAAADMIASPLMSHLTNVKNRKFTREMYDRQRRDALSDWAMQNEYDSPRAQMSRYQEAGLNPHLIYGQSNEGATVRSSSASGGSAEAPRSNFMAAYDMKMKSAQVDLVAKQMENIDADIDLKEKQAVATIASSNLSVAQKEKIYQDMGINLAHLPYDLTAKDIANRKNEQAITIEWMENNRRELMNAKSLEEATARIARMAVENAKDEATKRQIEENIKLLEKENLIKQFDVELTEKGIRPGDPVWWRVIMDMAGDLFSKYNNTKEEYKQKFQERLNRYMHPKNRGASGSW